MNTTIQKSPYALFATLLEYPWTDVNEITQECINALLREKVYPDEAIEELKGFQQSIADLSLDDLQGLYSYTFEISSGDFTLDLGYHTLDGFKRANKLLSLKEAYKASGFPYDAIAKGELPDNLVVVLKFLAFVEDAAIRKEMRESFLVKALEKLSKNFSTKKEGPYSHLLGALLKVVDVDVKLDAVDTVEEAESGNA